MKLDKIKFAQLVAMIASEYKYVHNDFIQALDNAVDVDVPEAPVAYPSTADINELMRLMAGGQSSFGPNGSSKIEAIKLHRKLTGYGLKDSKDEIEKHWPIVSKWSKAEMCNKLNLYAASDSEHAVIVKFIESL